MGIADLAALAGSALVSAAMTDAWQSARERVAAFFGRGDAGRAGLAGSRLDRLRDQLAGAEEDDIGHAAAILTAAWTARFADLLEEDPGAEADLRALLDEIGSASHPAVVSAAGYGIAAGRDVRIDATDGAVAVGVVHGNVAPPGPSVPGLAGGQPGPG